MTKPIVVLISSDLPQQGKDTFAQIASVYGDTSIHCSFAYELKRFICEKYGLDLDKMLNDAYYKEKYRDKLIYEGNHARMADAFIWAKMVTEKSIKPRLIPNSDLPQIIFISDCRYHNEAHWFANKELCGFDCDVYSVHIVVNESIMEQRFGKEKYYKLAAAGRTNSQRELNFKYGTEFDSVISNNGSIEEFRKKVILEMEIILERFINKC